MAGTIKRRLRTYNIAIIQSGHSICWGISKGPNRENKSKNPSKTMRPMRFNAEKYVLQNLLINLLSLSRAPAYVVLRDQLPLVLVLERDNLNLTDRCDWILRLVSVYDLT